MSKTIVLGGVSHEVHPVPLGRLKVLIPALTAFTRSVAVLSTTAQLCEADMGYAIQAIAAGLGKDVSEVEQMPGTVSELIAAVELLAEVSGLVAREHEPGELEPGTTPAKTSTQSTDSSPTS